MMQSFILMAVVTVIWAVAGYSLVFGEGMPSLGDLRLLFLTAWAALPTPTTRRAFAVQTFYQFMNPSITPSLIAGASSPRG